MKQLHIFLTFILLIVTACTPIGLNTELNKREEDEKLNVEYKRITAEEAKQRIENEKVILLDVRTQEEFEEKHIEGAILIPDYDIEDLAEQMLPHKDEIILVYCRSGRRSKMASEKLIKMGYTSVYDFGGIIDWPFETVKG